MIEPIRISEEQAGILRRSHDLKSVDIAKSSRKLVWQAIRKQHSLPESVKFRVNIDDPQSVNYRVLCDKVTGMPFGTARSGMPYGKVAIANAIPFLNHTWDDRVSLPTDAMSIGGGLFIKDGELYFPAV